MRFRPVIFAWCLLFGATLAMAAAAWWLLGREADRVEALAAGTLANRTASVAESIDLLMGELRDGVREGLVAVRTVPEPRIALAELVEGNPYIAAGFYFRGSDAVTAWFGERGQLPSPSSLRAGDGEFPWTLPDFEDERLLPEDVVQAAPVAARTSSAPSDAYAAAPAAAMEMDAAYASAGDEIEVPAVQQKVVSQNIALKEQRAAVRKVNVDNRVGLSSIFSSLAEDEAESKADVADFAELPMPASPARQRSGAAQQLADRAPELSSREDGADARAPMRQAWVSSMVGGTEAWMAWSGLPDRENYIGVWLNREAIVAELSKAISLSQNEGLRFRLVDAQGHVVAGDYAPRYSSREVSLVPELTLAVGSALPQWRIETFRANGANTFGSSFRLVGGLFIVGLSAAILLGSTLLIWQARRDARDAERKTTFVANVSHELKTPLTSIRLFADMLHAGRVKDPDKQRAYLQNMVNETQRLTRLVNNVLDFSRLERGQHRGQVAAIELSSAVREIVAAQVDRLQADGLSITVATPDEMLEAHVDRDALEQILLNLLDNAAKYASSGERAEVVLTRESSGWCLRVTDYGAGIPAAERKQVFNAFHRSDDRLTAERPGCGLGLSIAARLAEEMGGTLKLESNHPSGCSFILQVHG
ncbi:HAMP domain-containing sensor histidine kinase [Coraliomargarita algicola]|uniref:histidine kinase n=1 Tax=Coraliomargarita algicola TaxID=3092156 RepID=A0ABZ0RT45_9BACT|nr:HAMP domain-containing sensor histidine kinase [Coraliomargarita sp. J2-16]WPJ98140.1 HAMP domain-containing sensor histidine kinase [Coraliomargarita sp. J2-16]